MPLNILLISLSILSSAKSGLNTWVLAKYSKLYPAKTKLKTHFWLDIEIEWYYLKENIRLKTEPTPKKVTLKRDKYPSVPFLT